MGYQDERHGLSPSLKPCEAGYPFISDEAFAKPFSPVNINSFILKEDVVVATVLVDLVIEDAEKKIHPFSCYISAVSRKTCYLQTSKMDMRNQRNDVEFELTNEWIGAIHKEIVAFLFGRDGLTQYFIIGTYDLNSKIGHNC